MKNLQNYNFNFNIKFLFILLVLIRIIPAQLKDLKFDRLTGDDGLPSGSIYCVYKDAKGFIWFGTAAGLARFDGYDFKVYSTSADKPGSISYNEVRYIFEDTEGYLWCGTDYGLNKLDRNKDSFAVYRNVPNDFSSISDNEIRFVIEDTEGIIWVGTRTGGLNKYDKNTGKFTAYKNIPGDTSSLRGNLVWTGYVDRTGNIWVGTYGRGLNKYNVKNNNFDHYSLPFTEYPEPGMVTSIYEDANENIWVGTTEGLNKLTPVQNDGNQNKRYNIKRYFNNPPRFINSTVEDENNNIWVCCTDGLIILNLDTEEFSVLKNIPGVSNSLISSNLSNMYKDRDGIIWLLSYIGVSYYNKNKWKFKHSLNNVITKITEGDSNTLFLGTYNGLYSYNRLNNTGNKIFYFKELPDSYQHNFIYSISQVINNKMLFSMGPFFYSCEFNNGIISNYENIPNIWIAKDIYLDHDGLLWLNIMDYGIKIINNDLTEVVSIQNSVNDSINTGKGIINAIYEDKDNAMWIGTTTGLNKVVTERNNTPNNNSISFNIKHFKHKFGDTTSLSSDIISYIYEDNFRNLWVGTLGGGLNKYDKTLDKFAYYTSDDGLPDNMIMGFLPDNNNNLWISTLRGLTKFNPTTEKFKNYNKMDGLPSDQFFFSSCCKASDGEMYFGTMNGLVSFYPDSIKDNLKIPPVVLTSFKIFNKEVELGTSILVTDKIVLSYTDNFFSFEFSALDYTNPLENQYMYMLEGIDKDWVKTPASKREASYTDIDPGEYIFRVKGSNSDGVWNEEGVSVKIIITPPWWQTWWFKGCGIILVLGFIGFIRQRKISKIKHEMKQQADFTKQLIESQENERKRIAGELHDSLAQNLLIIKNKTLLGKKSPEKNPDIVNEISDLSSATLQEIREISYNLHPYQLERLGLTKAIESIIENASKSLAVNFKTDIMQVDSLFSPDKEINIYRIIQECINNIIKHSSADAADIKIIIENGNLLMLFKDNGKGFNAEEVLDSKSKRGLGLMSLTERAKLCGGKVEIESQPGKGTLITVIIPLGK